MRPYSNRGGSVTDDLLKTFDDWKGKDTPEEDRILDYKVGSPADTLKQTIYPPDHYKFRPDIF